MTIQEIVPKPSTVAVETCLKAPVERECPECGEEITLGTDTRGGDIVNCPACNFELEVAFFDPNNPAEVQKLIDAVRQQKTEDGKAYDVSHLNLEVSPNFIPAPQEEEDWGE